MARVGRMTRPLDPRQAPPDRSQAAPKVDKTPLRKIVIVLHALDVLAQRGLCDEEALGGAAVAARLREVDELFDVLDLHGWSQRTAWHWGKYRATELASTARIG